MKNLKIKTRFNIITVFVLVVVIAMGAIALVCMNKLNNLTEDIAGVYTPALIYAEEIASDVLEYRSTQYEHVVSTDPTEMSSIEKDLDAIKSSIADYISQYEETCINEEDEKKIAAVEDGWNNFLNTAPDIRSASASGDQAAALILVNGESLNDFEELLVSCEELVSFNYDLVEEAKAESDSFYASIKIISISVIAVLAVFSIIVLLVISRSITKPVAELETVAAAIANGDLNQELAYESKDELGHLASSFDLTVQRLKSYIGYINEIAHILDEIARGNLAFTFEQEYKGEFAIIKTSLINISDKLNIIMRKINESAGQILTGADQVAAASQGLSQGTTEQAASIEELVASIDEILAKVKEAANQATNTKNATTQAEVEANNCNDQMHQMIIAMEDISNKSNEIGKIIKTIEDIAFQTNILALNAAVEAARAGEAGKGFAVVADEVRNLATKSQEASKNTSMLIEGSMDAVEKGTKIAQDTAGSLGNVVNSARITTESVEKIAETADEQVTLINEVSIGVDQISSVVQTNSATSEQSAAASEELASQAQVMQDLVNEFTLKDDNGASSYAAANVSKQAVRAEAVTESAPVVREVPKAEPKKAEKKSFIEKVKSPKANTEKKSTITNGSFDDKGYDKY